MEYKKIVNVSTGVINTVNIDKFDELVKTGDYQEYKAAPKKAPGRPKKEEK